MGRAYEEQLEQGPKKIGRSFYRSDEYWGRRAEGAPPLGPLHEDVDLPQLVRLKSSRALETDSESGEPKPKRQVTVTSDVEEFPYEPTSPAKRLELAYRMQRSAKMCNPMYSNKPCLS